MAFDLGLLALSVGLLDLLFLALLYVLYIFHTAWGLRHFRRFLIMLLGDMICAWSNVF